MRAVRMPVFLIILVIGSFFSVFLYQTNAQSSEVQQLEAQIEEQNARLDEIEKEIRAFESQLQEIGAEKNTLNSAIRQLETERKKVQADVSYTQNKISTTDLQISQLGIEIQNTEEDIEQNRNAIAETVRAVAQSDDESMVVTLLRHSNVSEFWGAIEDLQTIQGAMQEEVQELASLKQVLEEKKSNNENKRLDLVELRNQYSDQQQVLDVNKQEKDQLLQKTKSEEAAYQALLEEKRAAKAQFEQELQKPPRRAQFYS